MSNGNERLLLELIDTGSEQGSCLLGLVYVLRHARRSGWKLD